MVAKVVGDELHIFEVDGLSSGVVVAEQEDDIDGDGRFG
jgi:hypothetical protein